MDDINIKIQHTKLINRKQMCGKYLTEAKQKYVKERDKHIRIVLYGTIICIVAFLYIELRDSYNFALAEIMYDQIVIAPIKYIMIAIVVVVVRSLWLLVKMTRPSKIRLFNWKISRGIADEIERLELELAKVSIELEEFEKKYIDV